MPPRLRAETMVRFHPIAQKQKTDLNIASVLVRAGGPGPGRAKTKPGRKSGCHIDLAWPGLGWAGEGAAGRGWRPPPTLFQPRPGPPSPGHTPVLQPPPDITSFQCVHDTADCLPGPRGYAELKYILRG